MCEIIGIDISKQTFDVVTKKEKYIKNYQPNICL